MSFLMHDESQMTSLATRLKVSPKRLHELLEKNEIRKSWGPAQIYHAVGLDKVQYLVRALMQCRELANTLESRLREGRELGPALYALTMRLTALALAYQSGYAIPPVSAPTVLLADLEASQQRAMELEARTNAQSHLSHTLEHLQAQLALMIFDVEQ